MLSGSVQSLATWWHEHREVPRELLVDRAIEFCWHGVERRAEQAVAVPVSSPAR
jgi:hypothetical protein